MCICFLHFLILPILYDLARQRALNLHTTNLVTFYDLWAGAYVLVYFSSFLFSTLLLRAMSNSSSIWTISAAPWYVKRSTRLFNAHLTHFSPTGSNERNKRIKATEVACEAMSTERFFLFFFSLDYVAFHSQNPRNFAQPWKRNLVRIETKKLGIEHRRRNARFCVLVSCAFLKTASSYIWCTVYR